MTSQEIRDRYLAFFQSKGHAIIPSAPLVPENDPSVLFNTAGMQPLIPYLLGKPHPMGTRLADVQKCVRTGDIDDVGDDSHLTFFEMLGNWSLGDYFKQDSIAWSWEFLTSTEWLGLDPNMISVTVFEGDNNAPRDEESAAIWKSLGMPEEKIAYLPAEDNWWAAGPTGPCGPDTEIFYWIGEGTPQGNKGTHPNEWMEIWNNVFMQYNRVDADTLEKLPAPCVDTGMGLERTTAILNNLKNVYETDAFAGLLKHIQELSDPGKYQERSARIIADHIRASVFLISDGVFPSNTDQGYVLRRLLRRSIVNADTIHLPPKTLSKLAESVINMYADVYPNLREKQEIIKSTLEEEETKFRDTLEKGMREFEKRIADNCLSGADAFVLFSSYGFPFEITAELAQERNIRINKEEYHAELKKHQELSRTASAGKFKGGLADNSPKVTAFHTATHLLLAALRKELGEEVHQAGSNITEERTRFDFTYAEKVPREVLDKVEAYVNKAIQAEATMTTIVMDKDEAKAGGIEGSFWEKYPEKVTVYQVEGPDGTIYSRELCGGPHVQNTAEIKEFGTFKIVKEEASSRGVRRIKGIFAKD